MLCLLRNGQIDYFYFALTNSSGPQPARNRNRSSTSFVRHLLPYHAPPKTRHRFSKKQGLLHFRNKALFWQGPKQAMAKQALFFQNKPIVQRANSIAILKEVPVIQPIHPPIAKPRANVLIDGITAGSAGLVSHLGIPLAISSVISARR